MQTNDQLHLLQEEIIQESARIGILKDEIKKIIIGHDDVINFIIIALLANGHVLLEGVPGVAKTTMVKTVTRALGLTFKRIQFTPDLLPTDLIGTLIYNPKTQEFETKKGPIFANLILADEINRAPAKVQSALLEAMQEQQATIGSNTYLLEKPFLVFATQNPVEQEGTYRLPEAQVDRFMFKVLVDYPTPAQEKAIIQRSHDIESINCVIPAQTIFKQQQLVSQIYVDEKIVDYIVALIFALRNPEQYGLTEIKPFLAYGVSSRASIALYKASQAYAFLKRRHFVIPDDVKAVAHAVLRHRLVITYEAEARNIDPDALVTMILRKVPCP
jgi:MoxR-like ATPase